MAGGKISEGGSSDWREREEQFPTLFKQGNLRVFKNPSNEVFVEDLKSGAQIRINAETRGKGGLEFTANQLVEPTVVNGSMIGWRVHPR